MVEEVPAPSATTTGGPIRRLPPASRLSLRIKDDGAWTPRMAAGLSLDLPINRFFALDRRFSARLGPDEWLIVDAAGEADKLRSEFAAALAEHFHAIVDVSQASVAFAVEGSDATNILNVGCPLDLDIRSFPAGSVTRTILGKCEIILFRLSEFGFRAECARSFGEYVHAFLSEAAELNVTTGAQ
jgi:sarcosine oxidase, subunit gamma